MSKFPTITPVDFIWDPPSPGLNLSNSGLTTIYFVINLKSCCVILQVVELLSMEDVDLTPEQIKDIITLLEKENKLRKVDEEQSDNTSERTEEQSR